MKSRLMLADDHQIVLEGLQHLLADVDEVEVVATAHNGHQVLHLIERHQPDIVIMDLQMPGMDGIMTTKHICKQFPEIRVLALSMHNEPHLIRQFLKAGAHGYVLKDAGKQVLLEAIEALRNGRNFYDAAVMQKMMENIAQPNSKPGSVLSKREMEIVRLIADQLTTTEIAEHLHLSPLTIETHRRNILLKLELRNVAGLIRHAARQGWLE